MWEWGGQEGGRAHAREREIDLNLVEIMLLFFFFWLSTVGSLYLKNFLIKIFSV